MDYITTTEVPSKLVPGLVYRLKKMSTGRRMSSTSAASVVQEKIDAKMEAYNEIGEQIQTLINTGVEDISILAEDAESRTQPKHASTRQMMEAKNKIQYADIWNDLTVTQLFPILIRWGLKSMTMVMEQKPGDTGDPITSPFRMDGKEATVETFLEGAPDDLIVEVGVAIRKITQMSFEEQMGFKSPGTSSTPGTGQETNTGVHLVEKPVDPNAGYADSSTRRERE